MAKHNACNKKKKDEMKARSVFGVENNISKISQMKKKIENNKKNI